MVLLGDFLIIYQEVNQLPAWVEFDKEITPTEGGTAHARAARPAGLSSPDFKFQALDTAWIPK